MKFNKFSFLVVFLIFVISVYCKDYGQKCHKGKNDLHTPTYCRQAAGDIRKDSGGQYCCRLPLSNSNRIKKFQRSCTSNGGNPIFCCPYGFSC